MTKELVQGAIIVLTVLSIFIGPKQVFFTLSLKADALEEEPLKSFDHSHSIYDSLLKKYVQGGRVDYKGFIASAEEFNTYLRQLGSVSEGDFENWSQEEKLAFWINAYNAFTIKAIMDNYPIDRKAGLVSLFYPKNSIRQIDGVWNKLRFRAVGRMVTLEEIEHEILRKEFKEPRIHFAIVCASLGCPDLMSEAYKADVLNRQLENAAVGFINNPKKGVQINTDNKTVKLSKIFDWFGGDFTQEFGNTELFKDRNPKEKAVLNFIREHLKSREEKEFLEKNQFRVSYLDYDWSLNELKGGNSPAS